MDPLKHSIKRFIDLVYVIVAFWAIGTAITWAMGL